MTSKEFNHCLKLIVEGNRDGIEKIYEHYYSKLVLTVDLDANDRSFAQDVVSNLMLSIFRNASHYSYIKSPDSWMYKAAKFAFINYKKSNKKYVYTEFIDDVYPKVDRKLDLKIEVANALRRLTPRQREIVQLHFVYGMKIRETAKIVGVSISTVNRAIIVVRDKLKYLKDF